VIVLGLWAIAGYLATVPVVGYHAFWREMRAEPDDFSLSADPAWFPAIDGVPLHGWFIPADGVAKGTLILAHGIDGNSSDMLPRAWFLVHSHYSVLLVDLRDHGKSGGNYASPGYMEARDILGALSYLRHVRHIRGPIAAFGHSYGAVACIFAAARSPDIAAVISDGTFISFVNMMHRATILLAQDPEASFLDRIGLRLAGTSLAEWLVLPVYYLRTGVWASNHRADVLRAIPRLGDRPILFIAGQFDEICPPQNAQIMYDAAFSPNKELFIVPGADHDSTYAKAPQLYQKTVVDFLGKAL
jgi:pimeloyl-ACP methyl ester carboxylesterase